MTNNQTASDALWQMYLTLSKLTDNESLSNNNYTVGSVAWHEQNARREAYHEATMKALNCFIDAC